VSTPTDDRAADPSVTAPPSSDAPSASPGPGHATAFPEAPPKENKRSNPLVTVLKLGATAAVIAFLWWKGAIKPEAIASAVANPSWLFRSFALVFACISIITIRWWLLLRLEKIHISLLDAMKLTLVGHFWNNVLPGAVTGDVVKMYYVGQRYPELKAEAYATVMIDRIIGLAALVYLSFASALANLDFIRAPGHETLAITFYANALAAGGFTVGILALVLGIGRKSSFADKLRGSSLPFLEPARRGYRTLIRLGESPGTLFASFALGMLSHALLVVIAISAGHQLGERHLDPKTYAFIVPVGLFVNSLPFGLPGGIGVGEAAMDQLFIWAGGVKENGDSYGAMVMVLSRLAQLSWGLVGAVVYVFDRKALTPKD
jgi:uncharacterized membrane protein YbhN (UPF0104 family)